MQLPESGSYTPSGGSDGNGSGSVVSGTPGTGFVHGYADGGESVNGHVTGSLESSGGGGGGVSEGSAVGLGQGGDDLGLERDHGIRYRNGGERRVF